MKKDLLDVIRIIKYFIILILVILAVTDINAGKDYNNTFTLGASGNASDTYIYMNSSGEGRFRWLDGTSKMQYSQDSGSTYINLEDSIRGLTSGPILFGDSDGSIAQDGNNLFYDNANNRLGLGTSSPNYQIDATGQGAFGGQKVIAGSTGLEIKTNNTLQLYNSADTFKINVKAPSALASSWDFTLPTGNGTNNYVLKTDGSGVTSWVEPTTVFTSFTSGRILYASSGGGFGQDTGLNWNDSTDVMSIGTTPDIILSSGSGIELKNNEGLSLYELTANGTNKVTLKAPSNMTIGDYTLTLPNDGDEPTGKMLRTNSGGNTYWGGINDIRSVEGLAISVSVNGFGDLIIDARARDENSFGGSTSTKPAMIGFRNSNNHVSSTIPNYEIIDDKQITIDKASSLGFYDDQVSHVYVYLVNVNNTSSGAVLAVSKYPFSDDISRTYKTTTTENGQITQIISSTADSAFLLYVQNSLTNNQNYAIKMIGEFKIKYDATAPTWINDSSYQVVNGNYESLYKEPLAMKRLIGNSGSDISLANNSIIIVAIESALDANQVETYDTYNIYDPPNTSVSCAYDGVSRWGLPSTALCNVADIPRFYIPISGYYLIDSSYIVVSTVTAGSVGNEITEYIDFNQVTHGTTTTRIAKSCFNDLDYAMTNKPRNLQCSHVYRLDAGDYVYFNVRQESGNTATLKRGLSPYQGEAYFFGIKLLNEVR